MFSDFTSFFISHHFDILNDFANYITTGGKPPQFYMPEFSLFFAGIVLVTPVWVCSEAKFVGSIMVWCIIGARVCITRREEWRGAARPCAARRACMHAPPSQLICECDRDRVGPHPFGSPHGYPATVHVGIVAPSNSNQYTHDWSM